MIRLASVWTLTFVLATFPMLGVNASEDVFNISKFYEQSDASQKLSLKIIGKQEIIPTIFLRTLIRSRPIQLMQIFADDVCVSKFEPGLNNLIFNCQSGNEIRATINCRNSCYMQSEHSKKGSWKFDYKYSINQNLPLDEILEFAGYTEAASQQENSANQDVQKTQSTLDNASKLDIAKSTCTELGFTLGTEKHGECVLKMMDN